MEIDPERHRLLEICEMRLTAQGEEMLSLRGEVERLREELRVLSLACLGVAGRADAARYVKSGTRSDH
jgi:hypothetical protein